MAQCGFFGTFLNFQKLQLFHQLQPEVEKLRFFGHFQYSENHRILLEMNCLYFHEFLFKLDACKLIKKILTHTFYFYKKQSLLQALMLFEGAWKIFFENSILLSAGPKSFKIILKICISGTNGICETLEICFLHMIYKINKRLRKIGLEK